MTVMNPITWHCRDVHCMPGLLIYNGQALSGKVREAEALRQALPPEAGFVLAEGLTGNSSRPRLWCQYAKAIQASGLSTAFRIGLTLRLLHHTAYQASQVRDMHGTCILCGKITVTKSHLCVAAPLCTHSMNHVVWNLQGSSTYLHT